jgi:hypothetical protein
MFHPAMLTYEPPTIKPYSAFQLWRREMKGKIDFTSTPPKELKQKLRKLWRSEPTKVRKVRHRM